MFTKQLCKMQMIGTFNFSKFTFNYETWDAEDEREARRKREEEEERKKKEEEEERLRKEREKQEEEEEKHEEEEEKKEEVKITSFSNDSLFAPQEPLPKTGRAATSRGPRTARHARTSYLYRYSASTPLFTAREPNPDIFDQKLKETDEAMARFLQDFEESEAKLNQRTIQQMRTLINNQKEELANHDYEWKHGSKAKYYNRESSSVKDLRTQYQLLLKLHMNKEAEDVKKKADKIAQQEKIENQKELLSAFLRSRADLERKQAHERKIARDKAEDKKNIIQAKKQQNTEIMQKRQRILIQAKQREARIPIKRRISTAKSLPRVSLHMPN